MNNVELVARLESYLERMPEPWENDVHYSDSEVARLNGDKELIRQTINTLKEK